MSSNPSRSSSGRWSHYQSARARFYMLEILYSVTRKMQAGRCCSSRAAAYPHGDRPQRQVVACRKHFGSGASHAPSTSSSCASFGAVLKPRATVVHRLPQEQCSSAINRLEIARIEAKRSQSHNILGVKPMTHANMVGNDEQAISGPR